MSEVVVLGATGRTGGATVRRLLAGGVAVRAVTRNPSGDGARALHAAGAEVVRADLDIPATLPPAVDGARALFNVQPAFDERGRYPAGVEVAQGRAVAAAAAAGGVEHVVQLSAGWGMPSGLAHFDAKLAVRAAMEAAGMAVTALHPAPFMELMTDPSFHPSLSTWGAQPRAVGWDRPLPWVAVADVGAAAARCLTDPVPAASRTLPLVGDVRSLRECREMLIAAGRRARRAPIPVAAFRRLVGPELPDMWAWMTDQESDVGTGPLTELVGRPLGVERWIARDGDDRGAASRAREPSGPRRTSRRAGGDAR